MVFGAICPIAVFVLRSANFYSMIFFAKSMFGRLDLSVSENRLLIGF